MIHYPCWSLSYSSVTIINIILILATTIFFSQQPLAARNRFTSPLHSEMAERCSCWWKSMMAMILTLSDHSVLGQRGILWRGWRLGETPILSTWGESTDPPPVSLLKWSSSLLTIFMVGLETWEIRLVRLWRDLRERRWAAIQLQVQTGMWHWARWCKLEVLP